MALCLTRYYLFVERIWEAWTYLGLPAIQKFVIMRRVREPRLAESKAGKDERQERRRLEYKSRCR